MVTERVSARLPKDLVEKMDQEISEDGELRKKGVRTRTAVLEAGVRKVLSELDRDRASAR